jgi:hypothetical protein
MHLARLSLACCPPAVAYDSLPSKPSGCTPGGAAGGRGVSEEGQERPGGAVSPGREIGISETRSRRKDDAGQFKYKNLRAQVAQGGSGAGEARGRRVFAPGRVNAE